MTKASALPYYPRFIFNCSDGRCFSTADVDSLAHIKDAHDTYGSNVEQFVPGREVKITWATTAGEPEVKRYTVDKIEIHQIKYDLDAPTYGMNSNDCSQIFGKEKKHMMEIYVFLKETK